jgi:MoaA/NifB/PqqE/SkfB family radical SAM enzyme
MADNRGDLPGLLEQSRARGVGHCVTLVSTRGFRRGKDAELPDPELARELQALWRRHPHLRVFEQTLERMEDWLAGRPMPECRAGALSFNVDHLGGVAPCIETIDRTVGNVRKEPLAAILRRLESPPGCQECYTLCRGMAQALGDRTSPRTWRDLALRFA